MRSPTDLSVAVLGGFSALAADLVWLRTYVVWERRDAAGTEAMLKLATALDGRCLRFWLSGARMMAYEIPNWRIEEAAAKMTDNDANRIVVEQARHGLEFLERAFRFHPDSAELWVERANIELYRLHDIAAAAESYRRASLQADAPYIAARIHAELLRRLGRNAQALEWLVQLHPKLPKHVDAAAADVVLARIRSLESELGVRDNRRYSEAGAVGSDADRPLTQIARTQ